VVTEMRTRLRIFRSFVREREREREKERGGKNYSQISEMKGKSLRFSEMRDRLAASKPNDSSFIAFNDGHR